MCPDCHKMRVETKGCVLKHLLIDGKKYPRLTGQYERGKAFKADLAKAPAECPDCSAQEGQYHHFACREEICPIHRIKLSSCDCERYETAY